MASFSIDRRKLQLSLQGELQLAGDKSITHRAIILSALSCAQTSISNPALNDDCLFTIAAFRKLGIGIRVQKGCINIRGKGLGGLREPACPLFVGESGTTIRLLAGLLAGQQFTTCLKAGPSLTKRPMKRVVEPLRLMGADISGRRVGTSAEIFPPLTIHGRRLQGVSYMLPVASAQVKSALLLAGLYAAGQTTIIEPLKTRDHTERMLALFGARISVHGKQVSVYPVQRFISPRKIIVPADISSASFFIVAATLVGGSRVVIKNVCLNPTRTGFLRVLKRMGARYSVLRASYCVRGGEPIGDIIVKSSNLKGTVVKKEEIPSLIDELPILMVAASCARGTTRFEGVQELRVKETDRIASMADGLSCMGAQVTIEKKDKGQEAVVIKGCDSLLGARVRSFGDHRTAMSMIVAGLAAEGKTVIDDITCISKSFPDFVRKLRSLQV